MEKERRKLQLFSAGGMQYAVFADAVMTIAEWREPAKLPHAPASVLGVVSIHGRMLTVLDLTKLAGTNDDGEGATHILGLRGDEQLALAISEPGEIFEVAEHHELQSALNEGELIAAVIKHNGIDIRILNVRELFSTAIQGRERRRRRF